MNMEHDLLITGDAADPRLVLAHGAGAPMDSPFMNNLAEGLAARSCCVVRFEFPYMAARRASGKRRGPDAQRTLLQAWREVVAQVGTAHGGIVIGGKSMGGRMASMVADATGVRGLVCLGYPFHPPGRPEKLRTEHLPFKPRVRSGLTHGDNLETCVDAVARFVRAVMSG